MELWADMKDSQFIQVSSEGRIRTKSGSFVRSNGKRWPVHEHFIQPFVSRAGYAIVQLNYDVKRKYSVHRLMLETFSPVPNMDSLLVNHKDGDKLNNTLSNLEWCTREENAQHAMRMGLFRPWERCGELSPLCKLSSQQVEEIRQHLREGSQTQHALALAYGVSDCTISEIKTGRTRKNG